MLAVQTKYHQQCWLDSITNMEVPAKNTNNRHAVSRNNNPQIKPNGRVMVRFGSLEFSCQCFGNRTRPLPSKAKRRKS
jgi:hypothetical protein